MDTTIVRPPPGVSSGVSVPPYPPLLALQATRSSSVLLEQVRIGAHWIVAEDLMRCLARIRPRFLALQSSFCLGLSRAALSGVRAVRSAREDHDRHRRPERKGGRA